MNIPAKRQINGTFGEVYINGIHFGDIEKCNAEIEISRESVRMAGTLGEDSKITGTKGTGSLTFKKVYSREVAMILPIIKSGKDIRAVIVTNLKDPDAYGSEKVQISDVWFNNLAVIDFEVGKLSTRELKFGFNPDNVEMMDMIKE